MHCNSRSSLNFNNIVKSQLLCFNEAGSIINEKFCLEVENNENFSIFRAPLLDVTLVVITKNCYSMICTQLSGLITWR